MPNNPILLGPWQGVYIGDSTGMGALVPITATRTGGVTFKESLPAEYLEVAANDVVSGRHKIELTMSFLGNDELVMKITRGLSVSASAADAAPDFTQYTVLCVYWDENVDASYVFPAMRPDRNYSQNFSKTSASTTQLVLTAENRNRTTALFYKGDLAYCLTKITGRSPF